jgi:hypothetical protein
VKSEAQQRLIRSRTATAPTTFRYVSCWPAKDAVGESSTVALDRDRVRATLAKPRDRPSDCGRQIVGDGNRFEDPADLRTLRADCFPVVRLQARQPIKPIAERPCRHDPVESVRRHAVASRDANAFDPRQLSQVRTLAANHRHLCPVDGMKIQDVAVHRQLTR